MYFENQKINEEIFEGTIFEGIKTKPLLEKFKTGEFKNCLAEQEKVVKKVDDMKILLDISAARMTGKKLIIKRIEHYREDVRTYFEQVLLYLNN